MPRIVLLANFLCSTLAPSGGLARFVPSGRLDIPVPLNEDVIGIRVPYYNEIGKLEAQFDAHFVCRIGEARAAFTDLVIHLLGENDYSLHIDIPSGTLNLHSQVLLGCGGVILHRHGVCAVARNVVFSARERLVRLTGDVRVTLHHDQPVGISKTRR
ncbi:MAG: hypothetical protein JMM78_03025 [Candidatus Xiphinematobacter sp.]|nr:MAG: hypothetical protein JMM79_03060 [Candidatus Xiphinematobacter sp.]QQY09685.1 MAG: hypothetical protein JMM78_03025 [Candidatus Xiphinematobacter sp.]